MHSAFQFNTPKPVLITLIIAEVFGIKRGRTQRVFTIVKLLLQVTTVCDLTFTWFIFVVTCRFVNTYVCIAGFMSRYCALDGTWRLPVYACVRNDIADASKEVHVHSNHMIIFRKHHTWIYDPFNQNIAPVSTVAMCIK